MNSFNISVFSSNFLFLLLLLLCFEQRFSYKLKHLIFLTAQIIHWNRIFSVQCASIRVTKLPPEPTRKWRGRKKTTNSSTSEQNESKFFFSIREMISSQDTMLRDDQYLTHERKTPNSKDMRYYGRISEWHGKRCAHTHIRASIKIIIKYRSFAFHRNDNETTTGARKQANGKKRRKKANDKRENGQPTVDLFHQISGEEDMRFWRNQFFFRLVCFEDGGRARTYYDRVWEVQNDDHDDNDGADDDDYDGYY